MRFCFFYVPVHALVPSASFLLHTRLQQGKVHHPDSPKFTAAKQLTILVFFFSAALSLVSHSAFCALDSTHLWPAPSSSLPRKALQRHERSDHGHHRHEPGACVHAPRHRRRW